MKFFSIPVMLLLFAMTSIQFGSSLAKDLFPILGPFGATSLRLSMGSMILLAYWRPWREKISKHDFYWVMAYGASLGAMNLFFYLAIERIPLGIAVALEFIGPLSVAILSSRRKLDFLWVVLAFAGILMLLPDLNVDAGLDPLGVLFALISGLFWGLYIVFGHKAGQRMSGGTAASWGMFFAALIAAPIGLITTDTDFYTSRLLAIGLAVALLSSAVPYTLEMFALRKMPKKTFGILMSLEPAVGALMGLLYLGERLSVLQWGAIGLVICSSAGSSYTGQVRE